MVFKETIKSEQCTYIIVYLNHNTRSKIFSYEGNYATAIPQREDMVEYEGITYQIEDRVFKYVYDEKDRIFINIVISVKEIKVGGELNNE